MKQSIYIIALLFLVTIKPVNADKPLSQVASDLQASRDSEKLSILKNELNEQLQIATRLQQQRALNLQSGTADELKQTENRLAEITENIHQIKQEIQIAGGPKDTTQAVAVREVSQTQTPERTKTRQETEQSPNQPWPWWDLYHQRNPE